MYNFPIHFSHDCSPRNSLWPNNFFSLCAHPIHVAWVKCNNSPTPTPTPPPTPPPHTHRYLLGFGSVSNYLGYSAMTDFFPTMTMKPNPQCDSKHCVQRQREHEKYLRDHPPPEPKQEEAEPVVIHESNEWGEWIIVVCDLVLTIVHCFCKEHYSSTVQLGLIVYIPLKITCTILLMVYAQWLFACDQATLYMQLTSIIWVIPYQFNESWNVTSSELHETWCMYGEWKDNISER